MTTGTSTAISTIIVNLSDVVIRGIDDGLMKELANRGQGIEFKPVKESAFCDSAALTAFAEAATSPRGCGERYLEAVIAAGNWKISKGELRNALLEACGHEVAGMKALLEELKHRGYHLILESNHIREWIDDIKCRHRYLDAVFDDQVFSFDTGQFNRDSGAFSAIAARSHTEPAACLYIGNSARACQAAENAGMQAIMFTDAVELRQRLADLTSS